MAAASDQPPLVGLGADLRGLGPGPACEAAAAWAWAKAREPTPGSGSDGMGLKFRGSGYRKAMLGNGGTRQSERAVAGRLNWLARHQMADGSWSLDHYMTRCKDSSCAGPSTSHSDVAGTARPAALPGGRTNAREPGTVQTDRQRRHFLFVGQTAGRWQLRRHGHHVRARHGRHRTVRMFRHDRRQARSAAQGHWISSPRHKPSGGGWRYEPRTPGDTLVTGWQVMALKSGQMAGLNVSTGVLEKAKKFLFRGGVG